MTGLQMPKVQKSIISNRDKIISDIRKIIRKENVLSHEDEIRPYETDALTAYRQMPLLVALPETVEEVSEILKYCNANGVAMAVGVDAQVQQAFDVGIAHTLTATSPGTI